MADSVNSSMQKLNDRNYAIWKFKMKLVLCRDGLWDVVEKPQSTSDPDDSWAAKNEKAMVAIGLALEDSQLVQVMATETAKQMWDKLQDYHERSSLTGKTHIWRTLFTTRLSDGGSMTEHLNELTSLRLRLTALGEEVSDTSFVAAMLASLPKSYEGLLVALESRPDKDLTVDFVKGRLLDEGRRRQQEEAREEKALVSSAVSDKKSEKKKKEKVCYYCKKEGHFKRDCKKWAADQKKESAEKAKIAVLAEDSESVCLLAGKADEAGVWYFDSGATSHMTNDASILEKLDGSSESTIWLADGKSTKAVGMGTGRLKSVDGDGNRKNVTLANVYHVPSLAGNLLSVSKIADLGFEVLFDKVGCKVLKSGKVMLIGVRKGGLYHLKQVPEQALLAGTKHGDSCLHLWHRRLGHRDPEAVLKIVRDGLGHGLKLDRCDVESVCGSCCEGKMSRDSFPKKSTSRATAVGELVHTDLGGPMEVATPRGNRFFMAMVDDYSRYTIVYLLQKKSDAAERIREYCSLVKNQFGHYPKTIRSDGGGEYSSASLKKFFADNGILHEQTAPYSPQQNGVAERRNRYAVESVRCMLAESGLDKKYWGEAICTAIYLQNRLPSSSVDSTPYELWFGKKPSYGHLRIFGSEAYVHVPKEKRRKLDKKSERLVFVGYAEGRKAYRFVNLTTECITVSRDAKFLELCTVKEAVKQVPPKVADTVSIPLVLPEPKEQEAGTTPAGSERDAESEPDLETTQYDSASDGEHSFHGFPLDEIARRSKRSTKGIAPVRLIEEAYATSTALEEEIEPRSLHEALTCREKEQWKAAMLDELKSHEDNGTWDLVELPADRKAVGCRWVYKLKRNSAGVVTKHKARLVAQGYSQKFGQDYDEVFAPVTSHTTLRVLLALASRKGMKLKHFDVKTAYLYGELDQVLFMKQPPGYEVKGKEHLVCRLRKSIYGLKQSARCWNRKIDCVLQEMGFKSSSADHCLYLKVDNGKRVFLLVYVDDIMVGAEDEKLVDDVFDSLKQRFEITNLGDLNYFLGMEIRRENGSYSVCLSGYIDRVVEKFGLCDAKGAKTPMEAGFVKVEDKTEALPDGSKYRSLVGVLLYIAVCARPDIAVSAAILGRKVEAPTQADYVAAKRVVRYLKATQDWRLVYSEAGGGLIGYTDADWAGDVSTRKSTSGYAFCYGGGAVSWASRKQACVTLSSMESEYVALSEASQELIWLRGLLEEMGDRQEEPTRMLEDNQSCIKFVGSERSSRRSKHIETREHFVKELVDRGVLKLEYCATDEMAADVLTKPLGTIKQRKFSSMLGLASSGGNSR